VTAFTVDEARALRRDIRLNKRACYRDLPDLVDFMLATSLRIGEALAFEWIDIDLEVGTCTVVANVHRIKNKGLVRNIYPNNKLKRRTLRLPAWAIEMLRARYAAMPEATLVFPGVASGRLRDPSNTGADLRDAFADLGISNAKSHMFRKTGSSLMDDAGRSPRNIADQLGHNKVNMAQERYIMRDATTSGAAEVLEQLAL
jgi:integrase